MSRHAKGSLREGIATVAILGAVLYVILALTVFSFRHPWMTDTERLLYIGRAFTFGTVDYTEARPR